MYPILYLILYLILAIIFTIIGLFIGHIILFDSILLALIVRVVCNKLLGLHPAFCLLIAVATFGFLFWLQNTKVGFWIIGTLFSAFWACIFAVFAYDFSSGDPIWTYVTMGLSFIIMIVLHLNARDV